MSDLMKRGALPAPLVHEQPQSIWLDEYLDEQETKYFQIILKRWWLILIAVLIALPAAALWTYSTKPLYRSTARIQIDPVQTVLPYKEIEMFDAFANLETQAEVLKSEVLASRVVARLHLATDPNRATAAAMSFISGLSVSPVDRTQVLKVSYLSEDPQFAAQAVNALAAEYVDYTFDSKREATDKAREFLEKELVALKPKLLRSEEQLVKYARDHGMLLPDEKNNVIFQKVGDLNQEMTKVETQVLSNQYDVVKDGLPAEFPETLKTNAMRDLERRRSSLEEKRADMALGFGPKWPELIALDEQIADVKRQLGSETKKAVEQIKLEYDLAQAHRERVAAALADQNRLADQLTQDSIQYNVLRREVETDRQLRDGLLQRLKETGVSEGFRSSNIHVIDRGRVPLTPDSPNVPRNLELGLALGLSVGFMLAFFSEFLDRTVKTPEDVEQALALPFLAMIPAFEKSWKRATGGLLVQCSGRPQERHLVPSVGAYPYWESYRSLRTSLLLSAPDRQPKTILVTSALPKEGKSMTAVNFAITLAQTGARTLVLDLDMRKPSLADAFDLPRTVGMSRYLSGQTELHTEILQTGIPNLFVVPAGPVIPNPPELIGSRRMALALRLLGGYFEYIVIDGPPLMAVTDSLVIATQVDGVVLVVHGGKTSKAVAQKARNLLRTVDTKILGAVVTGAKKANVEYYQTGVYAAGPN